MRVVYFDTNVYTKLSESLTWDQVPCLSEAVLELGLAVAISPVVLLEILALGEVRKKEELLWVAQHMALPELLPEVESIIVDYAARISKDERVAHLILEPAVAREPLRSEWVGIVNDSRRTLRVTPDNIEFLATMRELYGLYHAAFSRGVDLKNLWGPEPTAALEGRRDDVASFFREKARQVRQMKVAPMRDPHYNMHKALVAGHIMCVGLSPFWDPIDEFWSALEIQEIEHRFEYVTSNPQLLDEGPLLAIYDFIAWQSTRKYSRGSWFDAYHLQYLQIIPEFLTLDRGLLEYGKRQPDSSRFHTNMKSASEAVAQLLSIVK